MAALCPCKFHAQVECLALRKALAILGLNIKGGKAFHTTLLEQVYSECKTVVDKD